LRSILAADAMAKPKNVTPTQQITIATTPQVVKILTRLAEQGLHGKNVAEVAERLLSERLREFVEQKRFPSDELANDELRRALA
jgi:hypothetical protein